MTEFENKNKDDLGEVLDLAKIAMEEVERDLLPLKNDDEETIKFYAEVMIDYRYHECLFLELTRQLLNPKKVLFITSGSNKIPKTIFGEDKVVHTGLETWRGDDRSNFPELGSGMKVVADNLQLPFGKDTFDLILILDAQTHIIGDKPQIYVDLLKKGGMVAIMKNEDLNPDDERIEVFSQNVNLQTMNTPEGAGLFRKI